MTLKDLQDVLCGRGAPIDIQLKPERKKVHRKSPA